MERHFLKIDKGIISYLEGNAPSPHTIFFLHSNSSAADLWTYQFNDAKLVSYRLIAFDLPGHGYTRVDGPPVEIYNVIEMSRIMAEAVSLLSGENPYILVGLSLGANVVAEMMAHELSPKGIALVSATLVGQGLMPEDGVMEGASAVVLYEDSPPYGLVEQYIDEAVYADDAQHKEQIRTNYNLAQHGFRSSLKASILAKLYSNEVALLKQANVPIFCAYGLNEKITPPDLLDKIDFSFWKNRIFKFGQAGHLLVLDQPQAFNVLLYDFVSEIFTHSDDQLHI